MFFIKNEIVGYFKKDVNLYLKLYSEGILRRLPPHIRISKNRIRDKRYQLYGSIKQGNVFVRVDMIRKKLAGFALMLFMWESLLTILIVLVVYVELRRLFKKQRYTNQFLRFVLVAISHKLGNFLSSQRINIELAEIDDESRKRLEAAMSEMEEDFKVISSTIKSITFDKDELKELIVSEEIKNILRSIPKNSRNVEFKSVVDKTKLLINPTDFKLAVSELINNAFKYSSQWVHVRFEPFGKSFKLIVRNDVKSVSKGSGIGFKIIEFLCRKNGWIFTKRIVDNTFESAIIFGTRKRKALL